MAGDWLRIASKEDPLTDAELQAQLTQATRQVKNEGGGLFNLFQTTPPPPAQNPMFDPATLAQSQTSQTQAPVPPPMQPSAQPNPVGPPKRMPTSFNTSPYQSQLDKFNADTQGQFANTSQALKAGMAPNEEALRKLLEEKPDAFKNFNLSPLLALTDSWTGSKLAQNYKAPTTELERQMKVSGLQDKLQTQQEKLADNELNAKKLQLNAMQEKDKLAWEREKLMAEQNRGLDGPDAWKAQEHLFDRFQKDKTVVSANEGLAAAQSARELLSQNLPMGDQAFIRMFSRATGEKGPLSDQDIERNSGSTDIANRLKGTLQKWKSGTMTEQDRGDFEQLIGVMEKAQQRRLDKQVDHYSNNVGPRIYGLKNTEDTRAYLGGGSSAPAAAQASAPQTQDAKVGQLRDALSDPSIPESLKAKIRASGVK